MIQSGVAASDEKFISLIAGMGIRKLYRVVTEELVKNTVCLSELNREGTFVIEPAR